MRVCRILRCAYAHRVRRFLENPDPEWMRVMGYDRDVVAFSRACQIWKDALQCR